MFTKENWIRVKKQKAWNSKEAKSFPLIVCNHSINSKISDEAHLTPEDVSSRMNRIRFQLKISKLPVHKIIVHDFKIL